MPLTPTYDNETWESLASAAGFPSVRVMLVAATTQGIGDLQVLQVICGLMREIATLRESTATVTERVEQLTTDLVSSGALDWKQLSVSNWTTPPTSGPEKS